MCYENNLVYSVYVSDQKFEKNVDLLLIINENKSHYVYVEDFNRLCAIRQKVRIKTLLQVLSTMF